MSITEADTRTAAHQFVRNWLFNSKHRKSQHQPWTLEQIQDVVSALIDYRATVVHRELFDYPERLRCALMKIANDPAPGPEEIGQMNWAVGSKYRDWAREALA